MHPSTFSSSIIHFGRRRCVLPRFTVLPRALTAEDRNCASVAEHKYFSTAAEFENKFAVVDHSIAYESAMRGRHGKQLALAKLEGKGKDDKPFDPFLEMERRKNAESGNFESPEDPNDDKEAEDDDDDESDGYLPSIYNQDGSLRRTKSQLATLRAGYPAGGLFAVIHVNGFQHKVAVNDILVVDRLKPLDTWKVGSTHTVTDVLLMGSSHLTLVGMPMVSGAEVDVMVEEITRDAKVIVFKKRRRKNSKRKNGFRRDVTVLRILDVRMPEPYRDHRHVEPEIELRPPEPKVKPIP
jgi:large subunit ribosomal protein L21